MPLASAVCQPHWGGFRTGASQGTHSYVFLGGFHWLLACFTADSLLWVQLRPLTHTCSLASVLSIGASVFSISPSNDHSGLISFRIDSFDLLAVPKIIQAISAGVWMDGWSHCFLDVFFRNSAYSRILCVCEYCESKKYFRRSNVKARHGLGREVVTGSFVCKGFLLHQPMMQALKEPLTPYLTQSRSLMP